MSKSMILVASILSALSLTLTACGTRHNRNANGKKPVMTIFGKTDLQLRKTLQTAWGKEWDMDDKKSQQLASEISGVGVATNSRIGDLENVTVRIVHADCKSEDVVMVHTIKPGTEVQVMEMPEKAQGVDLMNEMADKDKSKEVVQPAVGLYKVQIKCISADKSCNEYSLLISKTDAKKEPAGSVAVYVQQNANDFKNASDEASPNEHSQVWWVKGSNAEPMTASKATVEKAGRCEVKVEEKNTEEPPMHSEGE